MKGVHSTLVGVRANLQELTREVLRIRETFADDYRDLDQAVKRLSTLRKMFKECRADVTAAKKKGSDVTEHMKVLDEIGPVIDSLRLRLTPATGR